MVSDTESGDHERISTSGKETNDNDQMSALLGKLINRLNPFTAKPADPKTGLATGEMDLRTFASAAISGHVDAINEAEILGRMQIEVEDHPGSWAFKGLAHPIKTAVRIPYRFPVNKNDKASYWQTEHLLVGYAGDGARNVNASDEGNSGITGSKQEEAMPVAVDLGKVEQMIREAEAKTGLQIPLPARTTIYQLFISLATDEGGFQVTMTPGVRQMALAFAYRGFMDFLFRVANKSRMVAESSGYKGRDVGFPVVVNEMGAWASMIKCHCWPE
jgi:hypothetical protein